MTSAKPVWLFASIKGKGSNIRAPSFAAPRAYRTNSWAGETPRQFTAGLRDGSGA